MKAIYTLALFALITLSVGCKKEEKATDVPITEPEQTITDSPESQSADIHNSQSSLDWASVYNGTIPCADCPGIKTVLKLNDDNSYALTTQYIDKQKDPSTVTGTFTWDDTGSIIILDAKGNNTKYKVQEGSLAMLDLEGNAIGGELSNHYILKKA
jgi:uncharacterized lipoprotein NlpE involved in copper resistance